MRNFTKALIATILAASAIAACSKSDVRPNGACTAVAPPALLYPAPSSTGQPDGDLDIWVGYPANPSPVFSGPSLSASGAPTVTGPAWLPPSPGPTTPPGMAPLPNGDSPFISGIPALAPGISYTVSVTNTICNQTSTIGSFTTK